MPGLRAIFDIRRQGPDVVRAMFGIRRQGPDVASTLISYAEMCVKVACDLALYLITYTFPLSQNK